MDGWRLMDYGFSGQGLFTPTTSSRRRLRRVPHFGLGMNTSPPEERHSEEEEDDEEDVEEDNMDELPVEEQDAEDSDDLDNSEEEEEEGEERVGSEVGRNERRGGQMEEMDVDTLLASSEGTYLTSVTPKP